jgi:hypothetical protein
VNLVCRLTVFYELLNGTSVGILFGSKDSFLILNLVFPSPKIFSYDWTVQLKSIVASVQATDAERCDDLFDEIYSDFRYSTRSCFSRSVRFNTPKLL